MSIASRVVAPDCARYLGIGHEISDERVDAAVNPLAPHFAAFALLDGAEQKSQIDLRVPENSGWKDFVTRQNDAEAQKTGIWREALTLLLGTLADEMASYKVEAAQALAETLILSAHSTIQQTHRGQLDEGQLRGAEARLDLLLGELNRTKEYVLFPLAPNLHQFVAERSGRLQQDTDRQGMLVAGMRILFWLLRVMLSAETTAPLDPVKVAETILSLYEGELQLIMAPHGCEVVWWPDDFPAVVSLPWLDLGIFMHQRGLARRLIEPERVDFDAQLRTVPTQARLLGNNSSGATEHDLYRMWIRKARLHVRILMGIHEKLRASVFDPLLGLTSDQHNDLRCLIEERLREIVQACAGIHHGRQRPSLFDLDNEIPSDDARQAQGLLIPLVHAFNRFSGDRRDQAFADWIAVESHPAVLLMIINEALPLRARRHAVENLRSVDLDPMPVS